MESASLEERITRLEERVGPPFDFHRSSCVESLTAVAEKLRQVKSTREAISQIWSKISSLRMFLDPELEGRAASSDAVKCNIVLSGEQHVKQTADRLQAVSNLKGNIDTKHLEDLPACSSKLQPLVHVHISQQTTADQQSEEIAQLLTIYNEFISVISRKLLEWNNLLLSYEEQNQGDS
ncbi:dynactin subunit 3-like [Corticium candelabrum]|uniref:dynactin subunit 3-like n=1 Tax=Corticium candelabrum TaxID=121492 RepID=UPI002E26B3FC|nr:dynactin subunit 3-like [Corticium candelabrum]